MLSDAPPRPATVDDVRDAIGDAVRCKSPLLIKGGGSKEGIGRSIADIERLDMQGFAGVIDYDPAELVIIAGAGTRLTELETLTASQGQMLAFEPFDHGPIFGREAGAATIGGIIAAGVAGSQRLAHGGARDHLLGFEAVSGRGEHFVAGARVVKNVTGYDLPKLIAGSWGRLAALTRVTLRVLPCPLVRTTVAISGLGASHAVATMAGALASPAEISAAAHFPAGQLGNESLTVLRIQGFGPSVAARCSLLVARIEGARTLPDAEADRVWLTLRTLAPLSSALPLWRVSVPPKASPAIIDALRRFDAQWMMDWAGGLIWVAVDASVAAEVREATVRAGGHASLIRAADSLREQIAALQPQPRGVAMLEERVRRAFDPAGIFETGRF